MAKLKSISEKDLQIALEILQRAEITDKVWICISLAESMHKGFNAGISRRIGDDGKGNAHTAIITADPEAINRVIALLDQIDAEREANV